MAPIAVRDALLDAFRIAVQRCDDPREVLSKAFADVMNRADGNASHRVSYALVQASQDAVRTQLASVLPAATRAVEDRRWVVGILLNAAKWERAFRALRWVQDASVGDRKRALDFLLEVISETQADDDPPLSDEELPDTQLFRAFLFSATALGDPGDAATLLAAIHFQTSARDSAAGIDHMLSTFVRILPALDDSKTETDLLYDIYTDLIDYDTADAVESLVHAAGSAIAGAADLEAAFRVLLDGLTVQPAGWPPPTPSWLRME